MNAQELLRTVAEDATYRDSESLFFTLPESLREETDIPTFMRRGDIQTKNDHAPEK